jgi:transcription elongation factor Elf1
MIDLNQTWIEIDCPKCGYAAEVQLVDVKTEKTIFCHNCKVSIKLSDNEASVNSGIESMNNAMNGLEKLFKNFGK